jgi:hypothetical protein
MAVVKISDILTPDVWNAYGAQRTAELSAFWSSGIVASMDGITLPNGGGTINIPHFGYLTGDAEVLSDSAALTPGNITAAKQVAAIIGRGRAWGANDLATVFAGADPAAAILDRVAEYWSRQMQAELIQILSGVFAAASMSGLISDISAGASETVRAFNASTFIDATQLLGDAKSNVSAVAMHSATEAYLAKQQLIVYETPAGKSDRISYYLGKRIIVDDGLPVAAGTYTSYIFGAGAVGYAEGVVGASDIENDRDILAGENVFTMRRRFILHPRGIKWQGTPAGDFPTRTELATGTNWVRVFDAKQIPIVQFKHKLA